MVTLSLCPSVCVSVCPCGCFRVWVCLSVGVSICLCVDVALCLGTSAYCLMHAGRINLFAGGWGEGIQAGAVLEKGYRKGTKREETGERKKGRGGEEIRRGREGEVRGCELDRKKARSRYNENERKWKEGWKGERGKNGEGEINREEKEENTEKRKTDRVRT